jgi:hypothetical protein
MNNRSLACFAILFLTFLASALSAGAQTAPLSPGTVSGVALYNGNGVCPSEFFSASPANPAVCYSATMTCANQTTTPNLNFIYSYDKPASPLGTVVFFPDGPGELGSVKMDNQFAADYYNDGYEIVQIAWTTTTGWEQTSDTLGIMTAACRPAGFMNYVLHTSLLNARIGNSSAGLCAQGSSAGSGALGYTLAWYGDTNGSYLSTDLDNVELVSGPVFGDVQMGCEVAVGGQHPVVPICYPGQQFGCSIGTTGWGSPSEYIDGYAVAVRNWTNDQTCAGTSTTSGTSNRQWKAMSIVTGTGGNFTYPSLGLAGWLCATSTPNSCTDACPNNSASEGEQFYNQIGSSSQAAGYKVTGILGCMGAENVVDGQDPDNCPGPNCQSGRQAFESHMTQQCKHPTPP